MTTYVRVLFVDNRQDELNTVGWQSTMKSGATNFRFALEK